jgi:hypothetical protein
MVVVNALALLALLVVRAQRPLPCPGGSGEGTEGAEEHDTSTVAAPPGADPP